MAKIPNAEWFKGRANYLYSMNKDRQELFEKIDDQIHMNWELPTQLQNQNWVFKQVTQFFRQVHNAAVRLIADTDADIKITPYDDSDAGRDMADQHERAIKWLLDAASRRRPTHIVEDMAESSVRYSEIAQQVMFLPVQMASIKQAGGNENRYKAMTRRGPYVIITHNPGTVFARYSDMGPEEICVIKEIDPHEVVDIYGDLANDLKDWIAENSAAPEPMVCTLYDYVSYDYRAVWVSLGKGGADAHSNIDISIIEPREWKWPFLPWVVRYKGTSLEGRSDHKRRTLLSDGVYSNAFETMNRVKTLRYSENLRYAGSPKKYFQSDERTSPGIVGGQDLTAHITGDEAIGDLNPPGPDPALGQMDVELRMDQQRSTLSEILFGGEVPSGAAFASLNLVTHSAMGVLKPSRMLVQDGLADLAEVMLLWAHYTQTDLKGYETGRRLPDQKGAQYLIKWNDIDPENLYIEVEIKTDVPTDRQARMLTAAQGVQAGIMSSRRGMEEIGIADTKSEEDRIIDERYMNAMLQMDIENENFLNNIQVREQVRQEVMMEVMAQMQAEQAQQGGAPPGMGGMGPGGPMGGGEPVLGPGGPPGPGMGGDEYGNMVPQGQTPGGELLNPAAGGAIPAELAPGETRELVTNKTQGGEEIAEV